MKQLVVLVAVFPAAIAIALAQDRPSSRQPGATLKADTELVEVDAFVVDGNGRPVSGLTAGDFEVLEDGVAKPIETFAGIQLEDRREGRLGMGSQPEPDMRTNIGASIQSRTFVLVLDDLHVSQASAVRVRSAIHRFIDDVVTDADHTAVMYTSGRDVDGQPFTSHRRLLHEAIDRFSGRKLRSATIERLQDPRVNQSGGQVQANADIFEVERGHRAQTLVTALRLIGSRLGDVSGRRKTVLLVSEGIDVEEGPGRALRPTAQWPGAELPSVLQALQAANTLVYTLDPRGGATGAESLIESSTVFETQGLGVGATVRERQQSQDFLRVLSANTGGAFLLWRPDMGAAFERILQESTTYYLLGYAPAPAPSKPTYRRIQVRMKRGVTYQVTSRNGYLAGSVGQTPPAVSAVKGLSTSLARALDSVLPLSALPLRVVAIPYGGPRRSTRVAIALEGQLGVPSPAVDGDDVLEVAMVMSQRDGRIRAVKHYRIPMNEVLAAGRGGPWTRVRLDVPVSAGAYQLQMAATFAQRVGSLRYDLEVPDYDRMDVAIGGVTIRPVEGDDTPTVTPEPAEDGWPGSFGAAREFRVGQELAIAGELYVRRRPRSNAAATLQLLARNRNVVQSVPGAVTGSSDGRIGFGSTVPLNAPAGQYILRWVFVVDGRTVEREVPVVVN